MVLAVVVTICLISHNSLAGPFNPILTASFSQLSTPSGESFFKNSGASAGVINGQVEGITSTFAGFAAFLCIFALEKALGAVCAPQFGKLRSVPIPTFFPVSRL